LIEGAFMTYEHLQESSTRSDERTRSERATPGRTSASASLRGPDHPIASGILMRKASGGQGTGDPDAVAQASTSAGSELPGELRDRFEGSLDTDLSSVRVHTGADSAHAADSVAARAYTVGNDIHFGANQYDPGSRSGQELIAHEVAHTVQQRGGSPTRQHKLAVSEAGDAHEVEADRAAGAMVAGAPATVSSGGPKIARKGNEAIGHGSADKKRKVDTDKASLPDGKVSIKMFGKEGDLTFSESGVTGGLKLVNLPAKEEKLFAMEHKWPWQLGPAGGVMLVVKGDIKGTASASITASGGVQDFGGPRENTMGYTGSISATGTMGLVASGRLEVLGYFGAGFANINAGGYVDLSASVSASLTASGTIEIGPDGSPSGNLEAAFSMPVTVKGTGGIKVGWEALIASGEFYEAELVSRDFLTGSLGKKSTYNVASGLSSTVDTSKEMTWKPLRFTEPKELKKGVAAAAEKAVQKIKNEQKKQGIDLDNDQCIPPDEKKQTNEDDCDPNTTSCEES
jgi:hypothetical protein